MAQSDLQPDRNRDRAEVGMTLEKMLFDPRQGDAEDDRFKPQAEIVARDRGQLARRNQSAEACIGIDISILLPAILLGSAPLVTTIWFAKASRSVAELTGLGTALMLAAVVGLGWIGWRPLWRIAEVNFWSLNALAVQPGYAFCREALRYLGERVFSGAFTAAARGAPARGKFRRRRRGSLYLRFSIAMLAWPATHWVARWRI